MVARGKGGEEVVKDKGGQIHAGGGRSDFGWWAHNVIYRLCTIEMYT